jgi:hypothetical protein
MNGTTHNGPRRPVTGKRVRPERGRLDSDDSGMALLSALLLMGLMSALLIGFFATIQSDQQASGINRDQTQAYAAAHAGLEKLTADLGALFIGGNYSPTAAQINALTVQPPTLTGFSFLAPDGSSGYTITQQATVTATVPNGPFQGLQALLTPYQVNVTARASAATLGGAAEVKMRRVLQTAAVPVFQFGVFSENDLSFFPGAPFNFGGRVHTNQNLFLASQGSTLTMTDIVTAVGEVVRTHLANGVAISTSGHTDIVNLATTSGSNPVFRNLSCYGQGGNCSTSPAGVTRQEGSVTVASVPPSTLQTVNGKPTMVLVAGNTPNEPTWTNVSTGTFNNRIRNGRTGVIRLDLPLVSDGAMPVDIIRRPSIVAPDTTVVLGQRFFSMASVRILLSDRASDITGLQTVTATAPVNLAQLARDATYQTSLGMTANFVNNIPLALEGTYVKPTTTAGFGYRLPAGTPINDGFLKIERQDRNGNWTDVTVEILKLGFTGRNLANAGTWNTEGTTCSMSANDDPSPNAVIRLQRVRDKPSTYSSATVGACGHSGNNGSAGTWSNAPTDYLPLALYDPREGARRDDLAVGTVPLAGGVIHYVELDVYNLQRWLTTHGDTMDVTGFVVYFSDRRGNKNLGTDGIANPRAGADGILYNADAFGDDQETGEFGFEDIVNPASGQGVSNGVLDTGEDVNGNGVLDTYGGAPRLYPTTSTSYALANNPSWAPAHTPTWPAALTAAALNWPPATGKGYQATTTTGPSTDSLWAVGTTVTLTTPIVPDEARVNPPVFFRRALKIVDGGYTTGTLRLPHNGSQGLSIVAENAAYVQGNYNAPNAAGTDFGATPGTDHVSAAVIADAVTLLSNSFNDIGSFQVPHDVTNAVRAATTTWYRLAVISGKGLTFPRPTSNTANDNLDFGTDGGAHNFLRYIEDWGGQTLNYRGSIVSFYTNRQAVGIYKCCKVVYSPPTRGYKFDSDFLTISLLPPRTPMFRDINALTFRELLRPNQ